MKIKRILSAVLGCSIFVTSLTFNQSLNAEKSFAASSCVIDTTDELQTIRGFCVQARLQIHRLLI